MKIKELETKGTVEGVIASIEERKTKNGSSYIIFELADGETMVPVRKWDADAEHFKFAVEEVVFVDIKAEKYKEQLTYIAENITPSSASKERFLVGSPEDVNMMYNFLYKTAGKCGVYGTLTQQILKDNKDKLLTWGAAKHMHHNIRGGLLYHMYRMTKTSAYIASVYNKGASMLPGCRDVNSELLISGTILHDIGKLWELETNAFGASEYTVKGNLMGHAFIGAELVGKVADKLQMKDEDKMLLQHLILSHHGEYEYCAVAIPAIPEAAILHYVDMIDSRMYQFEEEAAGLQPGEIGARSFGLGTSVYRPTWRVPVEK